MQTVLHSNAAVGTRLKFENMCTFIDGQDRTPKCVSERRCFVTIDTYVYMNTPT